MDKVRQDISQHFVKFSFSALSFFAVMTCSCGIIVIVKYETMSSYFTEPGVLNPTKVRVSLKPEVWSAFHSQLCSFRCRENFESAIIVKREICLFNFSDKESDCVSIQRLFQRIDLSFQFVLERVLLNGENLGKPRDSYELVFECGKNKLLTYTLCEYVAPEVDRLPENELFLNYDADNPFGLNELTDSLCRCITKYIADNISLYLKLDCDECQNDYCVPKIHECIHVKKNIVLRFILKGHYITLTGMVSL
ncbi:PC4 domain-containing protein [Nephila pilipes]|uniref:PC4 domain-containing protein n=1 Tax=Nephila pilipes TaxID=299642 RepID=A0A8X6IBM3_NEPPI|nr:PC4 domain-containing protein [Nephila pilipes]